MDITSNGATERVLIMETENNEDAITRSLNLYRQQHYISKVEDIPNVQHYAVLVNKTRTYPDPYDDTNPNHLSTNTITDPYLEYVGFETEDALKDWMTRHNREKYVVIRVTPIKVNVSLTFEEMK